MALKKYLKNRSISKLFGMMAVISLAREAVVVIFKERTVFRKSISNC